MGWQTYFQFNNEAGLSFFDMKFKGDRVVYELALQDSLAYYGGTDPYQVKAAALAKTLMRGLPNLSLI